MVQQRKPELLAPAGNAECIQAAIENGADAVYFGLESGFNARARAVNFSAEDLPAIMEQLHDRNLSGYVTLNTLVFPDELPGVESLLREVASAGVDAVLVQDVGVARLARAVCPDLPLHASTQMTMTSAETIELAEELGMERVVLARELSISEIAAIREKTDMPLEVFVHGALCVAYSGQCLTSESLGGRSANRGQCAQACRLSYELISDGEHVELGDQKYLLSPQDLAAYDLTPDLIRAGVCSFKIEGRLKTPEYVANITRHYRRAIDQAWGENPMPMTPQEGYEMEMSFSRGFSPGWLEGCDHKMLVPATSSSKRGVYAGTIVHVDGLKVTMDLSCSVAAGDGVVFEGDRSKGEEQGGRVFAIFVDGQRTDLASPHDDATVRATLKFGSGSIDPGRIAAGAKMWKTDDPKLNKRLRKTYSMADARQRVPVDVVVTCKTGQPIVVQGTAENGATCRVVSEQPLERAKKHPISDEKLREQLGRLGGTFFELRELETEIADDPMVPFSVLGKLRHAMIDELMTSRATVSRQLSEGPALPRLRQSFTAAMGNASNSTLAPNASQQDSGVEPALHVLCRDLEQVRAAGQHGATNLYAEFADIREYGEAVQEAHGCGASVLLATPRIQKPDEMGIFKALAKHGADGMLVRNFAGLKFFQQREIPFVVDFALNCSNDLTTSYFIDQGALRITPSYDLNREQLLGLVENVPVRWLECVIHQHMPMFHMEHCVFCSVMSPGTNKTNCGRPCDLHQVELRDRIGMEHPLTADVGCRNTLYNATPQSSAEVVQELMAQGVMHFRIELLRENAEHVGRTMELYRKLISGSVKPNEVWNQLRALNRVGVTRGTLEERNPLAIL